MIIAENNFRDEELFETKKVFESDGDEVVIASSKIGECTGSHGGKIESEISLAEVVTYDYDAVVFVGGQGSEQYFNDEIALLIAREMFENNQVVSAICLAPVILAKAGILSDKKATVTSGEEKVLDLMGATYVGLGVVVDGKIITASGPEYSTEFGQRVLDVLKGKKDEYRS